MTVSARICHAARRHGPWLVLLLLPAASGAAPPLDAAPPVAAMSFDGARRTHTLPGKTHIGRIFFSPAERRRRYADRVPPGADLPSADRRARAERLQIDGAVSSSTQGRAVWVNGTAVENTAKLRSAWTDRGGSIWLRDDRQIPRLVRPGQALDPASGTIDDLLPSGSVARR